RLVDGLGQHAVTGRILGDLERLQDRNAVVQQRAEDAREARQGEEEVDIADDRNAQTKAIDDHAAAVASRPAAKQDDPANRQQDDPPAMPLHEMAGAHERFGDGGQVPFFGQLSEDRLEFRHEENDQHIEHDEADDRKEYRI